MIKKIIALFMTFALLFSLSSCSFIKNTLHIGMDSIAKVAILTGSGSVTPEEYAIANELKAKYNDNISIHVLDDNYLSGQTSLYLTAMEILKDTLVTAIIFADSSPGTAKVVSDIKNEKPSIFIACCSVIEDYKSMAEKADLIINVDKTAVAKAAVENAKRMGAEQFIYYSFDRYLNAFSSTKESYNAFENECKKVGLSFKLKTSVDHILSDGLKHANNYIAEDAFRLTEEFADKKIAVFSEDRYIQKSLIQMSLEYETIYPLAPVPSVYSDYTSALSITEHPEKYEDSLEAVKAAIAKEGNSGKMGTWYVSAPEVMINSAYEYIQQDANGKKDINLQKIVNKYAGKNVCTISQYKNGSDTIGNMYVLDSKYYSF